MSTGRNDPCPCGSGKKFKRCHGASVATAANPDIARANDFKALDLDLATRLLRFARSHLGDTWVPNAPNAYTGSLEAEIPEHELALAIPWTLRFYRDAEWRTLAGAWTRDRGSRVTDRERVLLGAYANTWLSLWEVKTVERGVGAALVDLLTRKERFVYDVSASSTLDVHDVMLAMVLDCDGVPFFGGVHPQPLPPRYAHLALRAARKICRVRTRAVAPDVLRDVDIQLDLVDEWNDIVDDMFSAPPPTLTNTDGDLFALTADPFAISAPREEVIDRLASIAANTEPETESGDTTFVFTQPGNARHSDWDNTIIGRAVVARDHLRVETNSVQRADMLRARIEESLGGMIRHRLRQESNTDDLMTRAAERPATGHARPTKAQSPEISAMVREFRDKHMRRWVDESVPALDGLTPREAARSPRKRPALELLLKDIERSESACRQKNGSISRGCGRRWASINTSHRSMSLVRTWMGGSRPHERRPERVCQREE